MEIITVQKESPNRPTSVTIRRFAGGFHDFRELVLLAVKEIEGISQIREKSKTLVEDTEKEKTKSA